MLYWVLLFLFVATTLSLLFRGIYETFQLDVSFSVLGEGDKSLRVLLFSDIHAKYFKISSKKLAKALVSFPVDAFIFVGDMACNRNDQKKADNILIFISAIAKKSNVPFYAVSGNHDYYPLNDRLANVGIILLRNQSVQIKAPDNTTWLLVGLEDLKTGSPSYEKAIATKIKSTKYDRSVVSFNSEMRICESQTTDKYNSFDSITENCAHIVLAHNPDTIFLLPDLQDQNVITGPNASANSQQIIRAKENISTQTNKSTNIKIPTFLLSGHFHGGQIWMPFDIEYRLLRKETMARLGFRRGAYKKDGIIGYITRGLGCVIVPLRFLSYPELSFLELRVD